MRSHTGLPRPPGATAAPLAHHTSRTATAPPPVSPAPRHIPPTADSPARDAPTIAAPLTTTHAAAAVVRASSHAVWEQLYGVSGTSWSLERLMYQHATGSDPATPALEGNSTNSQQPRSPSSSFLPPAWVREFVGVHSASPAHTAPHSELSACPSQVTARVSEGVAEAQQTPSLPVTNTPSVSCTAAAAAAAPSEDGRKRSDDCPATLTAPLSNATAVTTSHRDAEGVTVSLRGGSCTSALFPSSPVPPSQAAADPTPFTAAAPPVDSGVPAPSAGVSLDGASAVVLRPVTQLSRRSALFASPGTLSSPPEWVLPPSTSEASLQPTRGAHATPLGGHSETLEKTKDAHRDEEETGEEERSRSRRRSCSEVLLAHSEEDDAEDIEEVVRGDDDDTAPTRRAMVNDEEAAAVNAVGVPLAGPSARCLDEEAENDAFSPFAPSDAVTPSMRLFSCEEVEPITHAKESSTTRAALDGLSGNAASDGCDGGLVDPNEGPDGDDDDSGYVTLPASPATALAKAALTPRDAGTDCRRPPHPMPLTPSPGPVVNLEATMTAMTVGTSVTTAASTTTAAAAAHTVSSPSVATVLFAHHALQGAAAPHEKGAEEPENNNTEAAEEEEARALWTSMERSITLVTEQVPHSSPSLTDDAGLVYSPPRCQQHEHSHSQQVEEERCSVSGDGGDATGGYGGSPMTPAQEPSSFFWKSLSSTPPPVAATDTSSLLDMATTANTQSAVSDVEQAEEEEEQTPFIESIMKDEEEEVVPDTADDDDPVNRQGAEADTAAQTVAAMVDEEGGFTTAEPVEAPAVLSTPLAAQVEGRSASVPEINVGTPSQTPHKQLEEKEGVVSCDAEALVLPSPESDSCRDSELSTTPRQVRYTAAAAAAPSAPSTTRTTADPLNGEAAQLLSDAPAEHTRTSPIQPSRPSSLSSSSAWGESSGTADATAASAAPAQPSPAPPRSSPGEHEAEPSSTPVLSPPRRSTPSDKENNIDNGNNNNAAAADMFDGRHSVSALDFTWAEEAEHALRQQQERLRARSHGMSISGGCGSLSPREGESRRALSASVSAGVTPAPGIPLGPQLYRPITAEELRSLRAVSSGRGNESLQQRLCSEGAVRSAWSASPQPQDPQSRFCTMSVAEESKRKADEDVEESCGVGSERAASSVSGGGGRVVEVDGELCDNTRSPHLRSLAGEEGEEETRCWQSLSPPSSSPSSSLLPTSASPLREVQAARHGGGKRDRSPPLTTDKNQPTVRRRGEVASTAAAPSHATPTTAKAGADELRSADSTTRRLQSISPMPHQDGFGGRDRGTVSRGAGGRPVKQDTSYSSETSRRFPLAHRAELSPSATIAATRAATMTTLTAHTPAQPRGGGGGGEGGAATKQRHRARLNATLTASKLDKSAGAPGSKNGNAASAGTNEFVLPRTVSPEPTPSPARAASPLLQQRAGNVLYAGRSAAGTALKGEKEKTKEKATASNALLRQGKGCVMGQAGDAGSRGGVTKKERKRSGKAAARGKPSIVALNENLRHRRQAEKENTN